MPQPDLRPDPEILLSRAFPGEIDASAVDRLRPIQPRTLHTRTPRLIAPIPAPIQTSEHVVNEEEALRGDFVAPGEMELRREQINPFVARLAGRFIAPKLKLLPDRSSEYEKFSVVDYVHRGETRRSFTLLKPILQRLDYLFPEEASVITTLRLRRMGMGVKSGRHTDTSHDYRVVLGLLGSGDVFEDDCDVPSFRVFPGDAEVINNMIAQDQKKRHDAESMSEERLVLVYGKSEPN